MCYLLVKQFPLLQINSENKQPPPQQAQTKRKQQVAHLSFPHYPPFCVVVIRVRVCCYWKERRREKERKKKKREGEERGARERESDKEGECLFILKMYRLFDNCSCFTINR